MAKILCPWPGYEESYIVVPDKWVGEHAQRHDEAMESAVKKRMGNTLITFAMSIALLDDWQLPGLNGNPDKWDFSQVELPIIAWVSDEVMREYRRNFQVPKNSVSPSPDG